MAECLLRKKNEEIMMVENVLRDQTVEVEVLKKQGADVEVLKAKVVTQEKVNSTIFFNLCLISLTTNLKHLYDCCS